MEPIKVGQTFRLFGRTYIATIVEPASDYVWHIEATDVEGSTLSVEFPTDTRTF